MTILKSYKSCLEATQTENRINDPEKTRIDTDSIKEIIKNL